MNKTSMFVVLTNTLFGANNVHHEKASLRQLPLGFFCFLHDREIRYLHILRVIFCFVI